MKYFILGIVISCLSGLSLRAQNYQKIDSLLALVEAAEDPSMVWPLYNQLAWAYRLSYPDSTLYYCDQVLKSTASSSEKATALNFRGIAYMYKGQYAEAFSSHRQALDLSVSINDSSQLAHSYNNLGRLFFTQGDIIKSYDYITNALSIFKKLEDIRGVGYCYKSLVQFYLHQNDTLKAKTLLQETLSIRRQLGDARGQISAYQDLATFHEMNHRYGQAHNYLQQAMALSDSLSDKISQAELNIGHADLFYRQGDYSKSRQYLASALSVAVGSENKKLRSSIYLLLAKNYFAMERYRDARLYLNDVIDTTKSEGDLTHRKEAYYYLAKIHEAQLQPAQSLNFYQLYIAAKDSLYNIERALTIERLENRLAMEAQDKEYRLLKADEARNQEVAERARIKNLAKNVVIVLTMLTLLTLLVWYRRVREKNRLLEEHKLQIEKQNRRIVEQNLKIRQQNEELSNQNKQLEEIDQEKDMLLDIVTHDLKAPFHRISGLAEILSMNLTSSEPDSQRYLDLIKYTSKDGSSLVNELLDSNVIEKRRAPSFEEVSLKPFLEKLIESFESQASIKSIGLHIQAEASASLESDPLFLARILENLISNAIKYSPSETEVYITAQPKEDDWFEISVKDEGPGFSQEDRKHLYQKFKTLSARPTNGESSHGLGLAIVKLLVERLQGDITLISEPGQGSEFVMTFPRYWEMKSPPSKSAKHA